jgi:hypothetical protein
MAENRILWNNWAEDSFQFEGCGVEESHRQYGGEMKRMRRGIKRRSNYADTKTVLFVIDDVESVMSISLPANAE